VVSAAAVEWHLRVVGRSVNNVFPSFLKLPEISHHVGAVDFYRSAALSRRNPRNFVAHAVHLGGPFCVIIFWKTTRAFARPWRDC
jgi:hypothetical protein